MLSKLLPVILLIVGVGAGIGAGIVLAPAPEPEMAAAHDGPKAEPEESDPENQPAEHEFIKLPNQFIVPVVERDALTSMVVVTLSLETKAGMAEKIRMYEPKLRDVFLQVLFDHANMGGFRGAFTRSDVMNPLRTALREAAQQQLGKDVYDVLIMDITRQDV
ncbi:flagellar basal body-associated FliL family protein [Phaeobacter sp. PT47_59]|uniref:flagellar basal body-associated FliL family protein n=1 Tax=Phaeobacter sp. PT47_59 TaxID=3029979 RepID=UPI002380BF85|nr:flagellar basal body-associated FliL family protein [Phaeobacter sp. PT47_59]MDE4172948.1 flagellar basal body-associated FliL family protein [Phaeobacter sp. PT47_59]